MARLQSEIRILEIKAMFKAKSLLTPKQMEHLINQLKTAKSGSPKSRSTYH
jgi:Spy/CpxP family protein refolding chaperone